MTTKCFRGIKALYSEANYANQEPLIGFKALNSGCSHCQWPLLVRINRRMSTTHVDSDHALVRSRSCLRLAGGRISTKIKRLAQLVPTNTGRVKEASHPVGTAAQVSRLRKPNQRWVFLTLVTFLDARIPDPRCPIQWNIKPWETTDSGVDLNDVRKCKVPPSSRTVIILTDQLVSISWAMENVMLPSVISQWLESAVVHLGCIACWLLRHSCRCTRYPPHAFTLAIVKCYMVRKPANCLAV